MPPLEPHEPAWIELAKPRITPGKGKDLGLFGRFFLIPVIRVVTRGRSVNIFATIGRNRRLLRAWFMFAGRLMPFGLLPRTDTEIVILRVGVNTRSRYEWAQHVPIGRRVGLSAEQIEAIKVGPTADGWSPRHTAILKAVDELHADRFISTTTWDKLAEHLDQPEIIELCMLTGHYEMVAMTLNSAGVQLDKPLKR